MKNRAWSRVLGLVLGSLAFATAEAPSVELLNVSYDPTRELYADYNTVFAAYWKKKSGQDVTVRQSHGRVAVEYSRSEWADDALLQLAQLEYAGRNPAGTVQQISRLLGDYPLSPLRATAALWGARAAFDTRETALACQWVGVGMEAVGDEVETRNQLEFQGERCRALAVADSVARTAPAPRSPAPAAARPAGPQWLVQVAALKTRDAATNAVATLKRMKTAHSLSRSAPSGRSAPAPSRPKTRRRLPSNRSASGSVASRSSPGPRCRDRNKFPAPPAVSRYQGPGARIVTAVALGSEPTAMLTGPAPAARRALQRAGLQVQNIGLWEVNEAFASVVLRFVDELALDMDRDNVNGGAIAMGHPLGATGAMILGTLLDELEARGQRFGLAALCVAAGMGSAAIIERI